MRSSRRGGPRLARAAAGLALLVLPACVRGQGAATAPAPRSQPTRTDTLALRRTIDSLVAAYKGVGVVGYDIRNLDTGERLALRADEPFPTASLIKVAILVTLYDEVEKGRIGLDDPLTLLAIDQVPGSGVLQFMHPGLTLSVHDAAWLMSTLSDNTATNLLLDKLDIRRVWAKMDSLGLHRTRVHAKVFKRDVSSVAMDSSVKYGLGVTTPHEMADLFTRLAQGRAVSPKADSAMLAILENNTDDQLMERYLLGVRSAHKTGAVDEARTECSLLYLRSRVIACLFTNDNQDQRWILDSEPQVFMARVGEAIARAWGPPPSVATP